MEGPFRVQDLGSSSGPAVSGLCDLRWLALPSWALRFLSSGDLKCLLHRVAAKRTGDSHELVSSLRKADKQKGF